MEDIFNKKSGPDEARLNLARWYNEVEKFDYMEFKTKAKIRYKIEAKNAELKNVFGYDRADSYGLDCMRMQGGNGDFCCKYKKNPQTELRTAHHYPRIRLHMAD